jgi:hypothetical protein
MEIARYIRNDHDPLVDGIPIMSFCSKKDGIMMIMGIMTMIYFYGHDHKP